MEDSPPNPPIVDNTSTHLNIEPCILSVKSPPGLVLPFPNYAIAKPEEWFSHETNGSKNESRDSDVEWKNVYIRAEGFGEALLNFFKQLLETPGDHPFFRRNSQLLSAISAGNENNKKLKFIVCLYQCVTSKGLTPFSTFQMKPDDTVPVFIDQGITSASFRRFLQVLFSMLGDEYTVVFKDVYEQCIGRVLRILEYFRSGKMRRKGAAPSDSYLLSLAALILQVWFRALENEGHTITAIIPHGAVALNSLFEIDSARRLQPIPMKLFGHVKDYVIPTPKSAKISKFYTTKLDLLVFTQLHPSSLRKDFRSTADYCYFILRPIFAAFSIKHLLALDSEFTYLDYIFIQGHYNFGAVSKDRSHFIPFGDLMSAIGYFCGIKRNKLLELVIKFSSTGLSKGKPEECRRLSPLLFNNILSSRFVFKVGKFIKKITSLGKTRSGTTNLSTTSALRIEVGGSGVRDEDHMEVDEGDAGGADIESDVDAEGETESEGDDNVGGEIRSTNGDDWMDVDKVNESETDTAGASSTGVVVKRGRRSSKFSRRKMARRVLPENQDVSEMIEMARDMRITDD